MKKRNSALLVLVNEYSRYIYALQIGLKYIPVKYIDIN
jgi:hypothetical protein